MVVTERPATAAIGVTQVRKAFPSMCMVQAPHKPTPHPNLEPLSLKVSLTTHSSGVLGSSSVRTTSPLSWNSIMGLLLSMAAGFGRPARLG